MPGTTAGMKKVLFGMALGAALLYLLDPQLGARRRDQLRARLRRTQGGAPPVDAEPIGVIVFDERVPVGAS